MVVVDLGLALLGALGLTRLQADVQRCRGRSPVPRMLGVAVCLATTVDLVANQTRQNAFVPARDWLAPPATVEIIRADSAAPRTYSPHHRMFHRRVSDLNHGWANIKPFYRLRDLLEPDLGGGYWNVPSADGYVGIAPSWYVSTWGYHYNENAFVPQGIWAALDEQRMVVNSNFVTLLRMYGVTHVLCPFPIETPGLTPLTHPPSVFVYRVEDTARVRVVPVGSAMPTESHATVRLRDPAFDPDREVLVHDAPASVTTPAKQPGERAEGRPGRADILRDDGGRVTIDADAAQDGFLVLADMFFPGWTATVDGVATPIYRANVSVRAVALAKGRHTVEFRYESAPLWRGMKISAAALAVLVLWLGVALYRAQRTGDRVVQAHELT
jgi:hypothetical protein